MPEIAELQSYLVLARDALDRPISEVDVTDSYYLKGGLVAAVLTETLLQRCLTRVRRYGKYLIFDVGHHQLGIHFGMTGHLLVDGRDIVNWDSSSRHVPKNWDRMVLHFDDDGDLRLRDRRRLGGVFLDPNLTHLGPDVLSLTAGQLAEALSGSRAPIKARMLDQNRLAGVGNLVADEALWRAGIDPARPAGSLTETQVSVLHEALLVAVRSAIERGETSGGPLDPLRRDGSACSLDGQPLSHRRIGGRTTWFCPAHQR